MLKSTLHLDLHPIAKRGQTINDALDELFVTAVSKNIKQAEIIPGKGEKAWEAFARGCQLFDGGKIATTCTATVSRGQLMKRVRKYLDQKHIKAQYKRVEVDGKNHGRLFVHFR